MTERKPITVTIDPSWWDYDPDGGSPEPEDMTDRRNWCEWCLRPNQECVCP